MKLKSQMRAEARSKDYTTGKAKRVDMRSTKSSWERSLGGGKVVNKESEGETDGHYNEDTMMEKKQGVCRII